MSNLYFVQNMMIFLEECFVKAPTETDYFTINPFYNRNQEARDVLRNSIQNIFPTLNYIPFSECSKIEWSTIYQSSYFEPHYQNTILSLRHSDIILVEDGLFDYVDTEISYDYYKDKVIYVFKPEVASKNAHTGYLLKLDMDNKVLSLFYEQYKGTLENIANQSNGIPILYTTPLEEDFKVNKDIVPELLNFIKAEFGTDALILKKHPRDYFDYNVGIVDIIECPQEIPGQFLDKACDGLNLFLFPSTVSFMCSELSEIVFLNVLPNNPDYNKEFKKVHDTKLFDRAKGLKVITYEK